jgi:hypothetical protein
MKAMIVYYRGEINDFDVAKIAATFPVDADVVGADTLSDNEVAAAVAKVVSFEAKKEEIELTPEDNATILIGTTLADSIANYNASNFVKDILAKVEKCKRNPGKKENKAFMNALFILSNEDLRISKGLLDKYGLDPEKIAIIKKTYNFISSL